MTRYDQYIDQITDYRFTEPDKALQLSLELYEMSMKVKNYHYASIARFYEGDAYLSLNELSKACEPLIDSIQMQEKYGLTDYLGKASNVLGAVFYSMGDYVLAMKYMMNALEISIACKDYQTQAFICNNIAAIFLIYDDCKHADDFYQKAWAIRQHCDKGMDKNQHTVTRMLLNRGICYNLDGKYEKAKQNLEEILAKVENEDLERFCMYIWELAASIYERYGEKDKAIEFAMNMVRDARKYCSGENIHTISDCLRILSTYGYPEKAEELLEIASEAAKKSESTMNELYVLDEWIKHEKIIGDEEACQKCYRKYYDLVQQNRTGEMKSQVYALENRNLLQQMKAKKDLLAQENDDYAKISIMDSLTGLLNRNGIKQAADTFLTQDLEQKKMFYLAIIDIDRFKECNDRYGHLTGDRCLKDVAEMVKNYAGDGIQVGRFGGDEFIIFGDGVSKQEWMTLCEKLHKACGVMQIEGKTGEIFSVTVSMGITGQIPDRAMSFLDYIHQADLALYQVKQNGRNGYQYARAFIRG